MKRCTSCKVEYPLSEFHNDKSRKDGVSNRCKNCRCKFHGEFQKKCLACNDIFTVKSMKGKAQKYCGEKCQTLHTKYGIDEYKYEDMLISSNYKCEICGEFEKNVDVRTGKVYALAVDHNHITGKVRGVLCASCNKALGLFKDNINVLDKAKAYLLND